MNIIYFTLYDKPYKYNQVKIVENGGIPIINIFNFRTEEFSETIRPKYAFKNLSLIKTVSRRLKDDKFDKYKELYEQLKISL